MIFCVGFTFIISISFSLSLSAIAIIKSLDRFDFIFNCQGAVVLADMHLALPEKLVNLQSLKPVEVENCWKDVWISVKEHLRSNLSDKIGFKTPPAELTRGQNHHRASGFPS